MGRSPRVPSCILPKVVTSLDVWKMSQMGPYLSHFRSVCPPLDP